MRTKVIACAQAHNVQEWYWFLDGREWCIPKQTLLSRITSINRVKNKWAMAQFHGVSLSEEIFSFAFHWNIYICCYSSLIGPVHPAIQHNANWNRNAATHTNVDNCVQFNATNNSHKANVFFFLRIQCLVNCARSAIENKQTRRRLASAHYEYMVKRVVINVWHESALSRKVICAMMISLSCDTLATTW